MKSLHQNMLKSISNSPHNQQAV